MLIEFWNKKCKLESCASMIWQSCWDIANLSFEFNNLATMSLTNIYNFEFNNSNIDQILIATFLVNIFQILN